MNLTYVLGQRQCTPDEIILDFDFSGAYSVALGAIPAIDWERLDRVKDQRDQLLPTAVDDIVPRYQHLTALGYVPPIFGIVMFTFPPECRHPCLPVRSANGLYYPLRSLTSATGLELVQARTLGADIRLRHVQAFPIQRDPETGRPVLVFADYIGDVNKRRKQYLPRTLGNMLYKEMANSLYGKLAQGIKGRQQLNFFDLDAHGRPAKEPLPESAITCPHYAALCTGIVRAALSAIVAGLDALPHFEVLSATTDGCMVKAPRRFDPTMLQQEEGVLLTDSLKPLDLYPELAALAACPAVTALMVGRANLDFDPHSWIEVKHVGAAADTYKTRMYHLTWHGHTQHSAHTGLWLEDETDLEYLHACQGIPVLDRPRLPSARDILDGTFQDYVEYRDEVRVNTDYDFKRHPLDDRTTRPFTTPEEFARFRQVMEQRRKGGLRADPASVQAAAGGMRLRPGETHADVDRRYIHIAIAREQPGWQSGVGPTATAAMLGIDYKKKFKRYRKTEFVPHRFPWSALLEQVAREEAEKIGRDLTSPMLVVLVCTLPARGS
jgi:hypothetical protein